MSSTVIPNASTTKNIMHRNPEATHIWPTTPLFRLDRNNGAKARPTSAVSLQLGSRHSPMTVNNNALPLHDRTKPDQQGMVNVVNQLAALVKRPIANIARNSD